MRTTEFFQQIRQIPVPWRDRSLCTPTFYYDVMSIEADFLATSARVQALLPSPRSVFHLFDYFGYGIFVGRKAVDGRQARMEECDATTDPGAA